MNNPKYTYRDKIAKFFDMDEDVRVSELTDGNAITLYVASADKAKAISKLIKHVFPFSHEEVTINVEDVSKPESMASIVKSAFAHNRRVRKIVVEPWIGGGEKIYVVCDDGVIQFPNDDLSDYRRNLTELPASVAQEIFEETNGQVSFCTADITENA